MWFLGIETGIHCITSANISSEGSQAILREFAPSKISRYAVCEGNANIFIILMTFTKLDTMCCNNYYTFRIRVEVLFCREGVNLYKVPYSKGGDLHVNVHLISK